MNNAILLKYLSDLPLGSIRYYESIASTNIEAARWVNSDSSAPDFSLIFANAQTAGKGRANRSWHTVPGASLAFSLIFRSHSIENLHGVSIIPRFTALGALAVCDALQTLYNLDAQIKWPNDVIIEHRKLAGILAESHWLGNKLQAVIVGVGVNVTSASVPLGEELSYPAVSVEDSLKDTGKVGVPWGEGANSIRIELLRAILLQVLERVSTINDDRFTIAWERKLAYLGEWVQLMIAENEASPMEVRITGLGEDGVLEVVDRQGVSLRISEGLTSLRPLK